MPRERLAVMKDALTTQRKEEFVSNMVQELRAAVTKNVLRMPRKEEFAKDTGQR